MSDEELLREWTDSKLRFTGLLPGLDTPVDPPGRRQRHSKAESELLSRGFVETTPGSWEPPSNSGT
jgi:hypothetical protein